ncbi:MAG: glycosyltransferase [Rhodobacteraceae bacterium]|nr:glycosyltransferase [Paracoccaceae bacterium]
MNSKSSMGRLTICIANLGVGGAQRSMIQLANRMKKFGWNVDILTFIADGAYKQTLHDGIPVHATGKSIPRFLRQVRAHSNANPDTIYLVTQANVVRPFCLAKRLGLFRGRIIIRQANQIHAGKARISERIWALMLPWIYRVADGWISLSRASSVELSELLSVSQDRISMLPNSIDIDSVTARALEAIEHPWLTEQRDYAVVIGAGRLNIQKGFDTLIDAVALANQNRPTRLIILGEGLLEQALKERAATHAPELKVAFPGFVTNPYAYMARADVFVLSSRWEGSPNALLEAVAIGLPCVACDCPSGPREILVSSELGLLCPVDDAEAMAGAILASLDNPGARHIRQEHIRQNHGVENWARAYERVLQNVGPGL